jgi:hypothetical protein
MKDENAAGRKTESPALQLNGYAQYVETILGRMTRSVGKALDLADTDGSPDEYRHRRQVETDIAIKLGKFSTDLILAINKMEAPGEK